MKITCQTFMNSEPAFHVGTGRTLQFSFLCFRGSCRCCHLFLGDPSEKALPTNAFANIALSAVSFRFLDDKVWLQD